MDKKLLKKAVKKKQKEIKQLKTNFNIGLVRNAVFAVGTDFYSPQMGLLDPQRFPVVLPLFSRQPADGATIESYQPFRLGRMLSRLKVPAVLAATDRELLGGDPSHLNRIKTGSELAVIMWDFIIDEVQIYQAKSFGADGLLLTSELLDTETLADFTEKTFDTGMEPFLEIQKAEDLSRVEKNYIGGLILSREAFDAISGSGILQEVRQAHPAGLPVLLRHQPQSTEEVAEWREKGIFHFLLPENWLFKPEHLKQLDDYLWDTWPALRHLRGEPDDEDVV
ncbi:MAG: hypothetical protein WAN36_06925 [Calditrichia bacterium]